MIYYANTFVRKITKLSNFVFTYSNLLMQNTLYLMLRIAKTPMYVSQNQNSLYDYEDCELMKVRAIVTIFLRFCHFNQTFFLILQQFSFRKLNYYSCYSFLPFLKNNDLH